MVNNSTTQQTEQQIIAPYKHSIKRAYACPIISNALLVHYENVPLIVVGCYRNLSLLKCSHFVYPQTSTKSVAIKTLILYGCILAVM